VTEAISPSTRICRKVASRRDLIFSLREETDINCMEDSMQLMKLRMENGEWRIFSE
jgi:hypothetical protein